MMCKIIIKLKKHNCDFKTFITRIFYEQEIELKRDKEFLIEIMKSNAGIESLYIFAKYLEENAKSILDFSDIILEAAKSAIDYKKNRYLYGDELSKLIVKLYDETEGKKEKKFKDLANKCLDIWDKMFEREIGTIKLLSKEISDR